MRAEASAISASEPGRRLPVPDTGDELARLGETLNEMLERLEEAIERERRFVDDASHELRTPLSNLKAEIDLACSAGPGRWTSWNERSRVPPRRPTGCRGSPRTSSSSPGRTAAAYRFGANASGSAEWWARRCRRSPFGPPSAT